jgi:predicted TPR repeat methyltransferase
MTSTATSSDPFVKRLQTIQHLITSGKLSEAAERLNAAVKSSPRDARIYVLGMRLAEAAGNPQGAQVAARKALDFAPDWSPGVTELAFLLARQNQFKEAMELAEKAVRLDGDNPEVLTRVIDIAHRAQDFTTAIVWLERAAALAPGNIEIMRLLARDWRITGQNDKALAAYNGLVEALPGDREALLGRIFNAMDSGDLTQAQKDCEVLLELNPDDEVAQFYLELARGNTPKTQPATLVRSLFDGFADRFDQHLVAGLKYKLPRQVAGIINERYPDRKLNVLDLGCGTGLLGACLGRIQGALVGVELSRPMIDQAIKHGVYDRFHNVDLLEALQATPGSLYDVIAALDVFVYVGDIAGAVLDAYRILQDGGHFLFSCELARADEADLVLRATQRYAHKASHVESMCRAAGFELVTLETMTLRYEKGEPVEGFLVIARKPGA